EGAVADVGLGVAGDVQGAVGGAGGDAVADGEGSVAAGRYFVGPQFAVDSSEEVGEAVELAAGAVAPIDHRVLEADSVGVPPAAEDVAVHGEVVADDVEVPGGGEQVERFVDVALSQRFGSGAVMGVLEPGGGGQLGGEAGVAFAQDPEHAPGQIGRAHV